MDFTRVGIPTAEQEALQPDPKWETAINLLCGGLSKGALDGARSLLIPSRGVWSAGEFSKRLAASTPAKPPITDMARLIGNKETSINSINEVYNRIFDGYIPDNELPNYWKAISKFF